MITIRTFDDHVQAGVVQSFLRDNEIDSILADEHANAWAGPRMLVPIRLQVPEEQAEVALALLAEFEAAPLIFEDGDV
jgi:hypothetical protein